MGHVFGLPHGALFWDDGFTPETEVRLKCTSRQVDMRYTLERRFDRFSGMTAHG